MPTSTDRPICWGILGTANIASKVGRAIHLARGATLAAVASRERERARQWVERHTLGNTADAAVFLPPGANVATCGSYLELLEDPTIDAVYIPLPPALHCEWACRAAEHGKHVLCEKPIALNLAEAQRMADCCAAANRQLMDGVMWMHHQRTAAMRRVLDSGELGRLRRVTSAFSFSSRLDLQNIRLSAELGGGSLGDLGWYCIRATLWALGGLPERVWATARYERGVDMNLSAVMWFSGQRMASFDCGFDTIFRKWMEIAGEQGSLVCDDFVVPWDVEKARFWVHGDRGKVAEEKVGACVQEVVMIERMCEIARSGRLEPHWVDSLLATRRVCDALAQSARSGNVVELSREPGV